MIKIQLKIPIEQFFWSKSSLKVSYEHKIDLKIRILIKKFMKILPKL
jgi:hypothetical protein